MEKLRIELAELERLYRINKHKLVAIKLFIIFNGILALIYAYDKLKKHPSFNDMTEIELFEAKFATAVILMAPLLFTPLYKYFSDRISNRINWDIKMSIFSDILHKYNINYHISFKGILPNEDLSFLKMENGITKFAYGDDLIFGTINTKGFRICELHSLNLLGKSFHGLVGVIVQNESNGNSEFINSYSTQNKNFQLIYGNGKYFLLKRSKSELFEFSIKRNQINKSKLEEDYNIFDEFVSELNSISGIEASKGNSQLLT
jgi:hypothetical protein